MSLLSYWLKELGCKTDIGNLKNVEFCIHPHIEGYERVLFFKTFGFCVVSIPERYFETFKKALSPNFTPETLEIFLHPYTEKTVGPAWIGTISRNSYSKSHDQQTSLLNTDHRAELNRFLAECDTLDIRNSGFNDHSLPTVGVFNSNRMVAAANYKVSKDQLANIGVITSPLFKGKGYGKEAISGIVETLLQTNYIIQYQTILANVPSVKAARAIGFQEIAETISYKLR